MGRIFAPRYVLRTCGDHFLPTSGPNKSGSCPVTNLGKISNFRKYSVIGSAQICAFTVKVRKLGKILKKKKQLLTMNKCEWKGKMH